MNQPLPEQNLRLLKLIKQALEKDLLKPSYRPLLQVRFPTRKSFLLGCRLETSTGQSIPFENLERMARATGTSGELDRWLMDHGLETLGTLHREEPESLLVVPQSVETLTNSEFPRWLERQKALRELSTQGLVLAFRLSAISRHLKEAHECFSALRELGVELMIEGFNDHPAALKLLRAFKSDYVSISESLRKAEDGVVEHRIKVCHQLGVRILVPGIDHPQAVNLIWSQGADLLAGDYLEPARPDTDFRFPPVIV